MLVLIKQGFAAHQALVAVQGSQVRIINSEDSPETAGFRSFVIYKGEQEVTLYESISSDGSHSLVLINANVNQPLEVLQLDLLPTKDGEAASRWIGKHVNLFLGN